MKSKTFGHKMVSKKEALKYIEMAKLAIKLDKLPFNWDEIDHVRLEVFYKDDKK